MEKDIADLKAMTSSKVDRSLYSEEMEKLKSLINAIEAKVPKISAKELDDIRAAIKKVAEHEERLKGFNT